MKGTNRAWLENLIVHLREPGGFPSGEERELLVSWADGDARNQGDAGVIDLMSAQKEEEDGEEHTESSEVGEERSGRGWPGCRFEPGLAGNQAIASA